MTTKGCPGPDEPTCKRFWSISIRLFLPLLVQKHPLQRELATRLAKVIHPNGGFLGEHGVTVVVLGGQFEDG